MNSCALSSIQLAMSMVLVVAVLASTDNGLPSSSSSSSSSSAGAASATGGHSSSYLNHEDNHSHDMYAMNNSRSSSAMSGSSCSCSGTCTCSGSCRCSGSCVCSGAGHCFCPNSGSGRLTGPPEPARGIGRDQQNGSCSCSGTCQCRDSCVCSGSCVCHGNGFCFCPAPQADTSRYDRNAPARQKYLEYYN